MATVELSANTIWRIASDFLAAEADGMLPTNLSSIDRDLLMELQAVSQLAGGDYYLKIGERPQMLTLMLAEALTLARAETATPPDFKGRSRMRKF